MPAAQHRKGGAHGGRAEGRRLRRIRRGEAITATGTVALFALLFAHWFKGGGVSRSGWSSLGVGLDVLLVVLLAVAALMLVVTVAKAKPAIVVGATVITVVLAGITFPIALIRVLVTQPDLDLGLGNGEVSIVAPAYLGLVALALTLVGAWTAMADERTDAADSAYTPPPARPLPGA